jgi:hypothetical protein
MWLSAGQNYRYSNPDYSFIETGKNDFFSPVAPAHFSSPLLLLRCLREVAPRNVSAQLLVVILDEQVLELVDELEGGIFFRLEFRHCADDDVRITSCTPFWSIGDYFICDEISPGATAAGDSNALCAQNGPYQFLTPLLSLLFLFFHLKF